MKLELGCGDRPANGYLHQDIISVNGTKLDYECNPWEIEEQENSFDEIIAMGVMEHLKFFDFKKTLEKCYFLLKPGGIFLFDVPNLKAWCQYYIDSFNEQIKVPFTKEHILNTLYGWQRWDGDEHKSGWCEESLIKTIKSVSENFTIEIKETAEQYIELGFNRNRFFRPEDKHFYIKLIKNKI